MTQLNFLSLTSANHGAVVKELPTDTTSTSLMCAGRSLVMWRAYRARAIWILKRGFPNCQRFFMRLHGSCADVASSDPASEDTRSKLRTTDRVAMAIR